MHGLDTSNVSSRVESSRAKWNLSLTQLKCFTRCFGVLFWLKQNSFKTVAKQFCFSFIPLSGRPYIQRRGWEQDATPVIGVVHNSLHRCYQCAILPHQILQSVAYSFHVLCGKSCQYNACSHSSSRNCRYTFWVCAAVVVINEHTVALRLNPKSIFCISWICSKLLLFLITTSYGYICTFRVVFVVFIVFYSVFKSCICNLIVCNCCIERMVFRLLKKFLCTLWFEFCSLLVICFRRMWCFRIIIIEHAEVDLGLF